MTVLVFMSATPYIILSQGPDTCIKTEALDLTHTFIFMSSLPSLTKLQMVQKIGVARNNEAPRPIEM